MFSHPNPLIAKDNVAIAPASFKNPGLNPVSAILASKPGITGDEFIHIEVGGEVQVLGSVVCPLG
jgi:hypothetical protein